MNKLIRLSLTLFVLGFITTVIFMWVSISSSFVFAGDNDIYITQSGTGLTMNIDQIGDTNKVGT